VRNTIEKLSFCTSQAAMSARDVALLAMSHIVSQTRTTGGSRKGSAKVTSWRT